MDGYNPRTFAVRRPVLPDRYPLRLKPARHSIDFTLQVIDATEGLEGDVVECGSYQGEGLITMAGYLDFIGSSRKVVGYDSFAGLHPTNEDGSAFGHLFTDTSSEAVRARIKQLGVESRASIVEGEFSDTLHKHAGAISVLVLDCDLYDSYLVALTALWDKVPAGGVVVLDEYGRPEKWPGAKAAVDEFLETRAENAEYGWWFPLPEAPRWYIRKA